MNAAKTRYTLILALFVLAALNAENAFGAEGHCDQCGCHKVKKVTRLVKTCKQVSIPMYASTSDTSFFPERGIVPHCKHRCESNNTVCGHSCVNEHCIKRKEPCEIITHVVRKGDCPDDTSCSTSEHHDEYYDYRVNFTHRLKMTSCPQSDFQTNLGASPCGCFKDVCLPSPTGQQCSQIRPEVKWVTLNVCSGCDHCWAD